MPTIVFSSRVTASRTIAEQLMTTGWEQIADFVDGYSEWRLGDARLIDCKSESILDIPTEFDTDYILVLSPHKMKRPTPMFTVHFPGNWNTADFGGGSRTLNIAYGSKLKQLLVAIERASAASVRWPVNIEVDHHGPTTNVPIMYVELGSSENEWNNNDAGKTIAKGIMEAIQQHEDYPCFFGVGGGHYATTFHKIVRQTDWAVGHILPKHHLASLAEDTFEQAIAKNVEPVKTVMVLKDETNAKDRERVRVLCETFDVRCIELGKNAVEDIKLLKNRES